MEKSSSRAQRMLAAALAVLLAVATWQPAFAGLTAVAATEGRSVQVSGALGIGRYPAPLEDGWTKALRDLPPGRPPIAPASYHPIIQELARTGITLDDFALFSEPKRLELAAKARDIASTEIRLYAAHALAVLATTDPATLDDAGLKEMDEDLKYMAEVYGPHLSEALRERIAAAHRTFQDALREHRLDKARGWIKELGASPAPDASEALDRSLLISARSLERGFAPDSSPAGALKPYYAALTLEPAAAPMPPPSVSREDLRAPILLRARMYAWWAGSLLASAATAAMTAKYLYLGASMTMSLVAMPWIAPALMLAWSAGKTASYVQKWLAKLARELAKPRGMDGRAAVKCKIRALYIRMGLAPTQYPSLGIQKGDGAAAIGLSLGPGAAVRVGEGLLHAPAQLAYQAAAHEVGHLMNRSSLTTLVLHSAVWFSFQGLWISFPLLFLMNKMPSLVLVSIALFVVSLAMGRLYQKTEEYQEDLVAARATHPEWVATYFSLAAAREELKWVGFRAYTSIPSCTRTRRLFATAALRAYEFLETGLPSRITDSHPSNARRVAAILRHSTNPK